MITKGEALQRRVKEKGLTQQKFATAIGYDSYRSVANWMNDEHWPTALEPVMEQTLEVPAGFFAQIARGVNYREALGHPGEARFRQELTKAVDDLVRILTISAPDNGNSQDWLQWQENIKRQLALLRRNMPAAQTPEDQRASLEIAAEVINDALQEARSQRVLTNGTSKVRALTHLDQR